MSTGLLESLAAQFKFFAQECEELNAPLYRSLSRAVSQDPEILLLSFGSRGGSPFQICFFAGVRFLLLKGVGHELGSIYRNAREGVSPDYESSFSCFKSVYLEYRHELKELINSLLIQTTVPGRCTYLMRVFDYVWRLSKRIL